MDKNDRSISFYTQLFFYKFSLLFFGCLARNANLLRRYLWVVVLSLAVIFCFHFHGKPDVCLIGGLFLLFVFFVYYFMGRIVFSISLNFFKKEARAKRSGLWASQYVDNFYLFFAVMQYLGAIMLAFNIEFAMAKIVYPVYLGAFSPEFLLNFMLFLFAHAVLLGATKNSRRKLNAVRLFLREELKSEPSL